MDPAKIVGDLMFLVLLAAVIVVPVWIKKRRGSTRSADDSPESGIEARAKDQG